MKNTFALTCIALLLVISCRKKVENPGPPKSSKGCAYKSYTPINFPSDSACTDFALNGFPLDVGNRWTYNVQYLSYNACGKVDEGSFDFWMQVVSEITVNGFRLAVVSSNFPHPHSLSLYDEGTTFASTYSCIDNNVGYFLNYKGRLKQIRDLSEADSAKLESDSGTIVRFDMPGAASWSSLESVLDTSLPVSRTWERFSFASVPVGLLAARKVRVYESVHPSSTYQYYSEKGLVQLVQKGSGLSRGPGLGPTYKERLITLTSVNF